MRRSRERQLGDGGGVELEGDGHAVAVVVGAHGRVDQREEAAADAVLVEARDHVEGVGDGAACGLDGGVAIAGRAARIEAGGKQLDEQADEVGVLGECRLDVGLAEREPDLAQVFGVCAQHRDLTRVEAGEQHETVEAVALDHAVDEADERLLHVVEPRLVEHHLVGHAHSDVVEIHARVRVRRPVASRIRGPAPGVVG